MVGVVPPVGVVVGVVPAGVVVVVVPVVVVVAAAAGLLGLLALAFTLIK